jgi:fructose 1,6-bisphosphatase
VGIRRKAAEWDEMCLSSLSIKVLRQLAEPLMRFKLLSSWLRSSHEEPFKKIEGYYGFNTKTATQLDLNDDLAYVSLGFQVRKGCLRILKGKHLVDDGSGRLGIGREKLVHIFESEITMK